MIQGMADVDVSELHSTSMPSTAEWRSICAGRHNVLLEGPLACTQAVLHLLKPHLCEPVTLKPSGAPLELHTSKGGTFVVHDIASFRRPEQDRILGWLDDPQSRTQVVCTTTEPLFPLVARGLFDETLYYRLNVILLQLTTDLGTNLIVRSGLPRNAWSSTAERSPAAAFLGSNL